MLTSSDGVIVCVVIFVLIKSSSLPSEPVDKAKKNSLLGTANKFYRKKKTLVQTIDRRFRTTFTFVRNGGACDIAENNRPFERQAKRVAPLKEEPIFLRETMGGVVVMPSRPNRCLSRETSASLLLSVTVCYERRISLGRAPSVSVFAARFSSSSLLYRRRRSYNHYCGSSAAANREKKAQH